MARTVHVDPVIAPREEIERASDLLLNGTLDTDQPMDLPPDSVFRYRNSDPLTVTCIVRQVVEGRGEDWLSFPRRALFDRIGIRDAVLETDLLGKAQRDHGRQPARKGHA